MKTGLIGYGYWGRNILRNLVNLRGVDDLVLLDVSAKARQSAADTYHGLTTVETMEDLLASEGLGAVVIATPVETHFPLGMRVLQAGMHLFVEKPMAASVKEADLLVAEAQKRSLVLMVDHTFLFTGAVRKLKELADTGTFGDLYYFDSTRINLGLLQHDVNVIWDLAPHDFSIMLHLMKARPIKVAAHGMAHFSDGIEDVAYLTVYFDNMIAHFHVSWLSPVKIRQTIIAGSKKMALWNDLSADEKIKIYDKGVSIDTQTNKYQRLVDYRSGSAEIPIVQHYEALHEEFKYFFDCIKQHQQPFNDGVNGLEVVRLLEASTTSLRNGGMLVSI